MQSGKNLQIDFIKILACLAVIGLHSFNKKICTVCAMLYYCCGFAVPAFFMATGYFVLKKDAILISYSLKKVKMLFRLVFLWNLVVFAVVFVIKLLIKHDISDYDLLTFPSEIFGSLTQKGYMWQFWYLGALMLIYILLPLIYKGFDCLTTTGVPKNRMLFTLWVGAAISCLLLQVCSYCIGSPIQENVVQTFRIWTWLQYFLLGGLMPVFIEFFEKKVALKVHLGIVVLYFVYISVYQNVVRTYILHNANAEYFYDDIFVVVWLVILFSFISRISLNDWAKKMIMKFSPLTLGIYIVHPLILVVLNRLFPFQQSLLGSLLLFFLTAFLSLLTTKIISLVPIVRYLVKI